MPVFTTLENVNTNADKLTKQYTIIFSYLHKFKTVEDKNKTL